MSGVLETLESLPPWVVPVAVVGVVILAVMSGKSGTGGGTGMVSVLSPVPADPNLVALAATESNNKLGAFQTLAELFGTTDVSNIAAQRDISIAGIQSDLSKSTTDAALAATLAADNVQQTLGLASTNAQLSAALDSNATTRDTTAQTSNVSLATLANDLRIAELNAQTSVTNTATQAKTQTTIAGIQENTTKATSKNGLFGAIGSVLGGVAGVFGL